MNQEVYPDGECFDSFKFHGRNSVTNESGVTTTRDGKGNSTVTLPSKIWQQHPRANEVTRLKPAEPREAQDLIEALQQTQEDLSRQLAYYESVKGTNPLQPRILALKLEIARLQALLRPLEAELIELQQTPIPQDLIVQQLEEAQTKVQQLARESTERKLRAVIEEDLDLRFKDATNDDKRNILKTRKMAATKSIIARFWPKPITLDGLATHSNRIFSAIEQTINFLKS